jgi:hypothetical protein
MIESQRQLTIADFGLRIEDRVASGRLPRGCRLGSQRATCAKQTRLPDHQDTPRFRYSIVPAFPSDAYRVKQSQFASRKMSGGDAQPTKPGNRAKQSQFLECGFRIGDRPGRDACSAAFRLWPAQADSAKRSQFSVGSGAKGPRGRGAIVQTKQNLGRMGYLGSASARLPCQTKPISAGPRCWSRPIVSNKANFRQREWPGGGLYKQTQFARPIVRNKANSARLELSPHGRKTPNEPNFRRSRDPII